MGSSEVARHLGLECRKALLHRGLHVNHDKADHSVVRIVGKRGHDKCDRTYAREKGMFVQMLENCSVWYGENI